MFLRLRIGGGGQTFFSWTWGGGQTYFSCTWGGGQHFFQSFIKGKVYLNLHHHMTKKSIPTILKCYPKLKIFFALRAIYPDVVLGVFGGNSGACLVPLQLKNQLFAKHWNAVCSWIFFISLLGRWVNYKNITIIIRRFYNMTHILLIHLHLVAEREIDSKTRIYFKLDDNHEIN